MFDIADTDISVISSVGAYVSSDKLVPLSINIHTHCDIVYPEWETWVGRKGSIMPVYIYKASQKARHLARRQLKGDSKKTVNFVIICRC